MHGSYCCYPQAIFLATPIMSVGMNHACKHFFLSIQEHECGYEPRVPDGLGV